MRAAIPTRNQLAPVATAAGLAALTAGIGWAISAGHSKALVIAFAATALLVVAATQRGAFIAVLLVAAMNGLPFVSTSQVVSAKLTIADVAIISLIVGSALWLLLDGDDFPPTRIGVALSRSGVALLLWWLVTFTRSVVDQHVSALHAAAFGRDFLYFALLIIVLPRARLTSRDIRVLLGVLMTATCLFAIGQIATTTGLSATSWLIHVNRTAQQEGLTRIYSNMTDLSVIGLAAAAAASLLARDRLVRAIAPSVALLLTTSIIVQLTRARWIGLIVGFLVVGVWLLVRGSSVSVVFRRRLGLLLALVGISSVAAIAIVPGILSSGTFLQRFLSIATDLESGGGTVAIRESVTKAMTAYLGGRWPSGIGLVPPSAHYFQGLPFGSIEDPDLGVLNAVMTMGAIGAFLIYLPVLLMLASCLRRTVATSTSYDWLRYGGAVWIVATLASSITLVTLFSSSGLALTAVALSILAHGSVSGNRPAPTVARKLRMSDEIALPIEPRGRPQDSQRRHAPLATR